MPLVAHRDGVLWVFLRAGALLPGARIRLEVDPDHLLPGVAASARLLEAPLDVREVAPVRILLVPVRQPSGLLGVAEGPGRARDSWKEVFRKLYPVSGVEIEVGDRLDTTAVLEGPHQDAAWTHLLGDLELRMDEEWGRGRPGPMVYGVVRLNHGTAPWA